MIEVDIFWSFAFGASFAAFGATKVQESYVKWWQGRVFVHLLLFLSLLFAPSGIYLLWGFPGWESMFVLNPTTHPIHPLLPCVFSFTNILFGIIGYYVTLRHITKLDKDLSKDPSYHIYWIYAYAAFSAILGFGFTYSGNHDDWHANIIYPMTAFVYSDVFWTLLAMGVVLFPPLFYLLFRYTKSSYAEFGQKGKEAILEYVGRHWVLSFCLIATAWVTVMRFYLTEKQRAYYEHQPFGWFAPLVGFLVAHIFVFSIATIPLIFTVPKGKTKKH